MKGDETMGDRQISLEELQDRVRRGKPLWVTQEGEILDQAGGQAVAGSASGNASTAPVTRLRDEEFADESLVRFTRSAFDELLAEIARTPPDTETGVTLVGWPDRRLVTRCLAAGERSHRSSARFTRAAADVQQQLDEAVARGEGVYLGEAHLHPSHFDGPSGTDVRTMQRITEDPAYLAPRALLGIVVRQPTVRP